jgi:hypothetical protein
LKIRKERIGSREDKVRVSNMLSIEDMKKRNWRQSLG